MRTSSSPLRILGWRFLQMLAGSVAELLLGALPAFLIVIVLSSRLDEACTHRAPWFATTAFFLAAGLVLSALSLRISSLRLSLIAAGLVFLGFGATLIAFSTGPSQWCHYAD